MKTKHLFRFIEQYLFHLMNQLSVRSFTVEACAFGYSVDHSKIIDIPIDFGVLIPICFQRLIETFSKKNNIIEGRVHFFSYCLFNKSENIHENVQILRTRFSTKFVLVCLQSDRSDQIEEAEKWAKRMGALFVDGAHNEDLSIFHLSIFHLTNSIPTVKLTVCEYKINYTECVFDEKKNTCTKLQYAVVLPPNISTGLPKEPCPANQTIPCQEIECGKVVRIKKNVSSVVVWIDIRNDSYRTEIAERTSIWLKSVSGVGPYSTSSCSFSRSVGDVKLTHDCLHDLLNNLTKSQFVEGGLILFVSECLFNSSENIREPARRMWQNFSIDFLLCCERIEKLNQFDFYALSAESYAKVAEPQGRSSQTFVQFAARYSDNEKWADDMGIEFLDSYVDWLTLVPKIVTDACIYEFSSTECVYIERKDRCERIRFPVIQPHNRSSKYEEEPCPENVTVPCYGSVCACDKIPWQDGPCSVTCGEGYQIPWRNDTRNLWCTSTGAQKSCSMQICPYEPTSKQTDRQTTPKTQNSDDRYDKAAARLTVLLAIVGTAIVIIIIVIVVLLVVCERHIRNWN